MDVISGSHKKALLKLAQRANEVMKEQWVQDCMVAFGWTREDADFIVSELIRMARRELNATD